MYKYGKSLVSSITSRITSTLSPSSSSNNDNETNENDLKRPADSKVRSWSTSFLSSSSPSPSSPRQESSSSSSSCTSPNTNTHSKNERNRSITINTNSPIAYSSLTVSATAASASASASASAPSSSSRYTNRKKRSRHDGYKTPMLVHPQHDDENDLTSSRSKSSSSSLIARSDDNNPNKRAKKAGAMGQSSSLLLEMIPTEVLESHVFSFLTDGRDFYALNLTCTATRRMCGGADILGNVDLAGDVETGIGSILHGVESPSVAVERLYRFAAAGNLQALYMIGMIAAYCHGDRIGVTILKQTARQGCLRSAYALGLILRDCNKTESEKYLNAAITKRYLPACQELLSSQTVKDTFGDLDHTVLKKYFDPIGLNRLLGRCYLHSNGVRGVATSHCWNPCCGRWALKATQSNDGRAPQLQSPSKCLPAMASHVEASLLRLTQKERDRVKQQRRNNGANANACGGCGDDEDDDGEDGFGEINGGSGSDDNDEEVVNLSANINENGRRSFRVSRMKMCSSCRRAKYCSKLCQVYDWRSGRHKMECQYL